jgi:hypothetical protein
MERSFWPQVTEWLAYDTHKLAELTKKMIVVVRLCDMASREEAKGGDADTDFHPHAPDGSSTATA